MATTPARRSRRSVAPIGSRPPGRRRRPRAALPAAQPVAAPPADRWTRIQQAVGTLAALGTLAVIVFTWLSIQQVDKEQALTREGQVTDRYNNAVTNLGDDSLEVRLGGIYALQRIMEDSPRDQPSIIDVLSTYLRNHAKKPKQGMRYPDHLPSDIQAALTALAARNHAQDGTARIDLRNTDLSGANLDKADLGRADLSAVNLYHALLGEADLSGANLHKADLRGTFLFGADLRGVWAGAADLRRSFLGKADLRMAQLSGANLSQAKFECADLTGADLTGADLTGADLTGAKR